MTTRHNTFAIRWGLPLLLFAAGVLVYANSYNTTFAFDDDPWIADNPSIRSLTDLGAVLGDRTRPAVNLSLAVNYAISGIDVRSYHVVNILIHCLAGLTLFAVCRLTFLTEPLRDRFGSAAPWLAFTVALLWLVHPLQTQSVTYVIQRSESMMGLFYLLTLYCAIRCAQGPRGGLWGVAACVVSALGMCTKQVMVTAPLIVLLYDRTFLAGSFTKAWQARRWLYVGLAATWGVLFAVIGVASLYRSGASAGFGMVNMGPWGYALTQSGVLLHYLRLSVWPNPLCLDYGWPLAEGFVQIVPATVAVLALLALTLWAAWRRSAWGFVGLWFFLILAPTSSIMPINDVAMEHRMYLSLAAVLVVLVVSTHLCMQRLGARPAFTCVLFALLALSFGVGTVLRNRDYRDEVTLWQTVVAAAPDSARARNNLGYVLFHQLRFDEAERHYLMGLKLKPNYANLHNNYGNNLRAQGKTEQAVHHFKQALRYRLGFASPHVNLGVVYQQQGDRDQAEESYRKALEIDPQFPEAHNNLGALLRTRKKPQEAMVHLRKAIELDPRYAEARFHLAAALTTVGEPDRAIVQFRRGLIDKPDDAPAHNFLGMTLAKQRQFDEAIVHFRRALEIDPNYTTAQNNLDLAISQKNSK